MSTGHGIRYQSQNPIQVQLNDPKFFLELRGIERTLIVYWNSDELIHEPREKNTNLIICHLEGYSMEGLVFTGSEFSNVILVTGSNIDTSSKSFLINLYHIVSRATKTVNVISHPSKCDEFKSLLTLADTDIHSAKQRCDDTSGSM